MGENGAGKTTLVKLINGLLKPSKGQIFVNNKNIVTLSVAELAESIGFVFQKRQIDPALIINRNHFY